MTTKKRVLGGLEVLEVPGDPQGATIILLHGYGADNRDLASLAKLCEIAPRPTWIFPNGPLTIRFSPFYSGKAWFPIDMTSLNRRC